MNSSKGYFTIPKELAALCIKWTEPIKFYTAKDTKHDKNIKAYSSIVKKAIKDAHQVTLHVGNGKAIGRTKVVIYLHCDHNSRFNAIMWKGEFKADQDLKFEILQVTEKLDCDCCKLKKINFPKS